MKMIYLYQLKIWLVGNQLLIQTCKLIVTFKTVLMIRIFRRVQIVIDKIQMPFLLQKIRIRTNNLVFKRASTKMKKFYSVWKINICFRNKLTESHIHSKKLVSIWAVIDNQMISVQWTTRSSKIFSSIILLIIQRQEQPLSFKPIKPVARFLMFRSQDKHLMKYKTLRNQ